MSFYQPLPYQTETVRFRSEDGFCAARFYFPNKSEKKLPAIVMANTTGLIKEIGLPYFAQFFANHNYAVLLLDFRNFGESSGVCREKIVTSQQVQDYQSALDYLSSNRYVDAKRIAIWGTGLSADIAIEVTAKDSRVKALVCLQPYISLYRIARLGLDEVDLQQAELFFAKERMRVYKSDKTLYLPLTSSDGVGALLGGEAYHCYRRAMLSQTKAFANRISYCSLQQLSHYCVQQYLSRLAQRPLLIVAAQQDEVHSMKLIHQFTNETNHQISLHSFDGGRYAHFRSEKLRRELAEKMLNYIIAVLK